MRNAVRRSSTGARSVPNLNPTPSSTNPNTTRPTTNNPNDATHPKSTDNPNRTINDGNTNPEPPPHK